MITLILLLAFFIVAAASWFMGLWSNMLTLVVMLLSGLIATNYFEPLAAYFDKPVVGGPAAIGSMATYTYLLDFICFWALFLISFFLLRILTDILSRHRVKFNFWVETVGRSILALWVAWIFVSIAAFSIQLSPLPAATVQSTPNSRIMLIGPDRIWMGFVQSRSRGALARGRYSSAPRHEDDVEGNYEPFDSQADLIYKYHSRREQLGNQQGALRVNR